MKKIIAILSVIFILSACNNDKTEVCTECDGLFSETVTMFVDAELQPCDGANQMCFMYQINEEIDENAWQIFDGDICGFTFEAGYRYKLSVKRKKIATNDNGEKVYQYCLLHITEKTSVGL